MGTILTVYDDIRQHLGFDPNDTDALPDEIITGEAYLTYVETAVQQQITSWSDILDEDGDRAVFLRAGTAAWVAARLAMLYFSAKEHSRVRSEQVEGTRVQYEATDWKELAARLADDAAEALARAADVDYTTSRPVFSVLRGPTRSRRSATELRSVSYWLGKIWPELLTE